MDMMEIRRKVLMNMASGSCLELLGEFTVAESRENDTLGNAKQILDNYVASVISDYDILTVFILVAENNTASQYQLQKMIWFGNSSNYSNAGSILRKGNNDIYSMRNISTSSSAWCSLGTILKLYRVKGV